VSLDYPPFVPTKGDTKDDNEFIILIFILLLVGLVKLATDSLCYYLEF